MPFVCVGYVKLNLPILAARRHASPTVVAAATAAADGENGTSAQEGEGAGPDAPARVPPSLDRSAPLSFIARNSVNLDGDFVIGREGEPTAAELANENLIKILAEKSTDEELNWLLWKCLGERGVWLLLGTAGGNFEWWREQGELGTAVVGTAVVKAVRREPFSMR